jgi:hypothetical protein
MTSSDNHVEDEAQKEKEKKGVKKQEVTNSKDDSCTQVNYPESVFTGVRKTVGFKCDTGLHGEFKRVAQAKFGSICKPLEAFEIAVLALNKEQVNFGTTVHIENLNVFRELRTRRKGVVDKCGFAKCDEPAIAEAIWKEQKIFPLCIKHLMEAREDPKSWRLTKYDESLGNFPK